MLGWLQPFLTDQFIKLAFHPDTFRTNPALIERERGWSNQNPPYVFRCALRIHRPSTMHPARLHSSLLQASCQKIDIYSQFPSRC